MAEENGATSRWVVMVFQEDNGRWEDVATVTVPPRTKRKTIIEKAFAQEGPVSYPPLKQTWRIRVLDEDSAEEIPVGSKEQPPMLVIG